MTLPALTTKIAAKARISKRAARIALETILEAILRETGAGRKVTFRGFGVFRVVQRAARKGRDPTSGATIPIPSRRVLVFRASSRLQDKPPAT